MYKAFGLVILSTLLASLFALSTNVSASGFQADKIMDDAIMTNSKSMTAAQIQQFLESKVPVCDTMGTRPSEFGGGTRRQWAEARGHKPPYTCLRDYTQNGKKASQIIYEVAQKYTINPQSLIVLLQKEQGLVTDTWPISTQYRSATGYGCPDTAPCDSQYYGLTNQLDWAAKMFRSIIDRNPNWYSPYFVGNNPRVYWHPDTGRCGAQSLNIKNWTTAGLYSYTPYRPNQAALNAGYGTGDSCSSYGNRNFFNYFRDWFGSTQYHTPFFRVSGSNAIYMLSTNNSYYYVPSNYYLHTYGLSRYNGTIAIVPSNYIDNLTNRGTLSSQVVKFDNHRMYVMDQGTLRYIPSVELLSKFGFGAADTTYLDVTYKDKLSVGPDITEVVSPSGGHAIYAMESGKKRHIASAYTYTNHRNPSYTSIPVTKLSPEFVNSRPNGTKILSSGEVVNNTADNKSYLIEGSNLFPVPKDVSDNLNLSGNTSVSPGDIAHLNVSSKSLRSFVKDSSGKVFAIDSGRKLEVDPSTVNRYAVDPTNIITTESLLSRLKSGSNLGSLIRNTSNGATFYVSNGKRYHIASPDDFSRLGYSWSNVINLSSSTANQITSDASTRLYGIGKLLKMDNDNRIFVVDGALTLRHISSPDVQRAYDLVLPLNYVSPKVLSEYTEGAQLNHFSKDASGKIWLVHNKSKRLVGQSLATHFGSMATEAPVIADELLSRLKSQPNSTNLITAPGSPHVYKVENGQKRYITSPSAMSRNGFKWSDVQEVPQSVVSRLANGSSI